MKTIICDVCKRRIKDTYQEGCKVKINTPYSYVTKDGVWIGRRKLDICTDCMESIFDEIVNRLEDKM